MRGSWRVRLFPDEIPSHTQAERIALRERMLAGDASARETLILSAGRAVYKHIARLSHRFRDRDALESLCLDAACRGVDAWKPELGSLETSIYQQMRSLVSFSIRTSIRKEGRFKSLQGEPFPTDRRRGRSAAPVVAFPRPLATTLEDEIDELLTDISKLPGLQKTVMLCRLSGGTNADAGKAIGMTRFGAANHIDAAIESLRRTAAARYC